MYWNKKREKLSVVFRAEGFSQIEKSANVYCYQIYSAFQNTKYFLVMKKILWLQIY